MPTIPENYPDGCESEQIKTTIREMQNHLVQNGFQVNSVLQFSPLINLGQSELERRQNEAIVTQSKRMGYISLAIAVIALGISIHGDRGSSEWEQKQLTILEKVSSQLNTGITCVLKSDSVITPSNPSKPSQK